MLDSITADSIFAEINMDETSPTAFLLVEGQDENAVFFGHVSDRVTLIVCGGKRNVLGAVHLANSNGDNNVYGLVDSDFDRIRGIDDRYPGHVVATGTYDLISDLTMSSSEVLRRSLSAHATAAVRTIEDTAKTTIDDAVFALTSRLAAARLASIRNAYPFVFKNYNFSPVIERGYKPVTVRQFLENAVRRAPGFDIDCTVEDAVQNAFQEIGKNRQMSGGHDIVGASVALLQKAGAQISSKAISGTLIAVASCQVLANLECLTMLSTIARVDSGVELFSCHSV